MTTGAQLSFDLGGASPPVTAIPPDQRARQRIATDLDSTLFVEAGAGAGKTTALVRRVVALVRSGVPIGAIAAITFTEKAAAELRHRLREVLGEELARAHHDPTTVERFATALDDLDHAPIGTLHAFARRVLTEFPVEAGIPPGFQVLDELESGLAFEERWGELLDRLLDVETPPGGMAEGGTGFVQLCEFDRFGLDVGVRRIAEDFHANWDLVAERVDRTPPPELAVDTDALVESIGAIAATPVPPTDRQAVLVSDLQRLVPALGGVAGLRARLEAVTRIIELCRGAGRCGNATNWKLHGGRDALADLRARETGLASAAGALLDHVGGHRRRLLGAVLAAATLESAERRADDGTLEFHDLLVLARHLVATSPGARRVLHRRYQRLLLDEFQDTDPIQLELAVRLAAAPDDPGHDGDWRALRPLPGRLFVVGDPKQSIYRFRRADIAQYLRAAAQVGADTEHLTANFRSSRAVIDWVNHTFARLIVEQDDVQPAFHALAACRRPPLDHGTVRVIGCDPHDDLHGGGTADEVRRREAADVVATIETALAEGWPVGDASSGDVRPCRPGDITVLLPARTSLPALETALRERLVPYRAENASVVYTTSEIRDLLLALRAADDPTDELALVATLRSPLYGCSDVELYEWKIAGGRWSIWSDPPDGLADHPVAAAVEHLRDVARRIHWTLPADLLAALVDERRVLDAALDGPDARDVWRRVRYVIDQARAWSDAGGHGLRRYLAWASMQAHDGRSADTILPEHDHDAVRIMTVHAAKGLEFPITVVSGLSTEPRRSASTAVVWPEGTWTLSGKHGDEVFDRWAPLDEQMGDAERRRLLYVACTRAVDHLVVSLHRPLPRADAAEAAMTSAALLAHAGAADPASGATPLAPAATTWQRPTPTAPELPWSDDTEWAAERERALTTAGRRRTISATRLAEDLSGVGADVDAGLAKDAVDLELPPWQRGRYGTAIGRAVHGVLQFADLRDGTDIAALAAAQAAAEGVLGASETVAALARSAIAAPIIRDAVDTEHHRELFVAADIDGRVLEGYVDLLVRTPGGLVIVDYKTDHWPDDVTRAERIDRYRRQLAAYAVALRRVLGDDVARGVLVRCRVGEPAEQIELDGWADAIRAIDAAVRDRG